MAKITVTVPKRTAWTTPIDYDVGKVKTTLTSMMQGNFADAYIMAEAMLGDDKIAGDLETRIMSMLGKSLEFELPENPRSDEIKEQLSNNLFWKIFPEQSLQEIVKFGLLLGCVVVQNKWTTQDVWYPTVKMWPSIYFRYQQRDQKYELQTEKSWLPLPTQAPDHDVVDDSPEFSLYSPGGYSRPWTGGLIRRLAIPWLIRTFAKRDYARWSERHGLPILKARIPSGVDYENDDSYKGFVQSLIDLDREGVAVLPQGLDADGKRSDGLSYDLSMLEAASQSWEGFVRLKEMADQDISVAILGSVMMSSPTEQKVGVSAAIEIAQDRLEGDANTLTTWMHQGPLRHWSNFAGHPDLIPWPIYDVLKKEDSKSAAETLKITLENIEKARALGFDTTAIENQAGLILANQNQNIQTQKGNEVAE